MSPRRFDADLRALVAGNLATLGATTIDDDALKRAAVCVIITGGAHGDAAMVLTRRSDRLNAHAGQFALPGGRVDPGESIVAAALREAREEIDLELGAGDIIGRLDDYPTRSGYLISPLVIWAPADARMRANPDEVAEIHRVPLAELELPGSPQFVTIPESPRPVIRYPILGRLIHAPTAALMYQFIEAGLHARATRVAHLEQPVWAWQ